MNFNSFVCFCFPKRKDRRKPWKKVFYYSHSSSPRSTGSTRSFRLGKNVSTNGAIKLCNPFFSLIHNSYFLLSAASRKDVLSFRNWRCVKLVFVFYDFKAVCFCQFVPVVDVFPVSIDCEQWGMILWFSAANRNQCFGIIYWLKLCQIKVKANMMIIFGKFEQNFKQSDLYTSWARHIKLSLQQF